jgi:hypothetical protein
MRGFADLRPCYEMLLFEEDETRRETMERKRRAASDMARKEREGGGTRGMAARGRRNRPRAVPPIAPWDGGVPIAASRGTVDSGGTTTPTMMVLARTTMTTTMTTSGIGTTSDVARSSRRCRSRDQQGCPMGESEKERGSLVLEEMGLNNQHDVGGEGWWRENGEDDD